MATKEHRDRKDKEAPPGTNHDHVSEGGHIRGSFSVSLYYGQLESCFCARIL
jgi:hypothetical protein